MLILSQVAKQEKNKLYTDSVFLLLLEIQLPTTIYICLNNEDVTWNGNLYQAFPFEIGDVSEDTDGSEPTVELKVSNITQALEQYIEEGNGGNGTQVILRVVNTKAMDNTEAEVEEYLTVTKCVVNQEWVTFTLGAEYSSRTRRPLDRYMKNNCPFKYKGLRCACTSSLTNCNHTLTACRERKNAGRFGGFQGIDQKGVYIGNG